MKTGPFILATQINHACEIWEEVSKSSHPADRWLAHYFHHYRKKFGSRDRRFLFDTVYAVFRHRSYLETWAEALGIEPANTGALILLGAAAEKISDPAALRGFWQEAFRKNLPERIFKALEERKLPHEIPGFGKGQALSPEQEMAVRFSFPLWLVKRWCARFGPEEAAGLLDASQSRPPCTIRVNTLKTSRRELVERLQKQGFGVLPAPHAKTGIIIKERANLLDSPEFREGLFEIQDEGSQIVCHLIRALPGETVWDVCAGGGGKSLHLADMMENKGRIIATDLRAKKLEELRRRARRAGVTNIFPADLKRMDETRDMRRGVDRILVDAPCSGTGTLRRNPDAKWKITEEGLLRHASDQKKIAESVLGRLKPGGRFFYITCSLEPEENEEVMAAILKGHPELKIIPLGTAEDGFLRLFPHRDGTDGFFLAVAEKHKGG